ncbi:hypothetical protein NE237_020960 [Protea cynaroides]|uniref:Uncharacterized protein n=1 Tax=Protea cynaroides TaxID=273540 RepID=A0A9Q0H883_9MAGN|nr:hypothetical protein NE237_020960 [Protea cynaroides]
MEGVEEITFRKDLMVEILHETAKDTEMKTQVTEPMTRTPTPKLVRQTSGKTNCLCSPTTHAGSFRCRLHRSSSLQRTKSAETATFHDSSSKATTGSTVQAQ